MRKLDEYRKNPWLFLEFFFHRGLFDGLGDKLYLKLMFRMKLGYKLNLKSPETFSEKIQWLKLYGYKSIYTIMVDKLAVKKLIADLIGDEYVIPTLGVWEKFDDIDFDALPNKFVLKCTHNSGEVVICKDKSMTDIEIIKNKMEKSLATNYYLLGREVPYKNVPRRIIAEKYIEDSTADELKDYKFYCFDGVPKYCQVISNRNTLETIDFFDMNWNHQEFTGFSIPNKPFAICPIPMPVVFDKMKEIASKLSMGIPFVRIDMYCVENKIYFGEMTFYPASGMGEFTPSKYNYILGQEINVFM